MKKRVWGILLTLMLCTAALCVGASAEETSSKWTFDYVREIDRQTHDEDCIAMGSRTVIRTGHGTSNHWMMSSA